MNGTPFRLAFPFALLLGLFTVAGCANTNLDRYGRPTYGNGRTASTRTADGRAAYGYPASARVGNATGARASYRLCHNERSSMVVRAPAVRAHLNHGDSFGTCNRHDARRTDGRTDNRRHDAGRDDDNRRRGWWDWRRDRDDDDDDDDRRRRGRDRDDDDDD
jgi:hypothetical protein